MQQTNSTPYEQLRTLKIVYTSLPTMIVLFALVVLVIDYIQPIASEGLDVLLYIGPALLLVTVPVGSLLFNNIINDKTGPNTSLTKKISAYQTALIIKSAFLEFPALIACIAALLTGKTLILLLIPLVLFLFLLNRPSIFRLENDLKLSRDEVDQIKGMK